MSRPAGAEGSAVGNAKRDASFADVHESWRYRLAPLPGYASQPDLRPMRSWDFPSDVADAAPDDLEFGIATPPPPTGKVKKGKKAKLSRLDIVPPIEDHGALSPRRATSPLIGMALNSTIQRTQSRGTNSTPSSPTTQKLDVYADVFVPRYLKDVQNMPHSLTPLPPAAIFPSQVYLRGYLTAESVEEVYKRAMDLTLLSQPAPPLLSLVGTLHNLAAMGQVPPLNPETYYDRFAHLLRWELDAQARQKEDIVLWKVGIKVSDWDEAIFALEDSHARGDTVFGGHVSIGDLVHLREVAELKEAKTDGRILKEYVIGGVGTGRAFEGSITAVRRREAYVYLYCPALKEHLQVYAKPNSNTTFVDRLPVFSPQDDLPFLFNVSFLANARSMCAMEHAVSRMSSLLGAQSEETSSAKANPGLNLAHHWLFPQEEVLHTLSSNSRAREITPTQWYDKNLNEEQRSAVREIASSNSPLPYLISGPPGTGKTKTVVEAVLQILRVQPEACLLLCAPSNPAADTLAQRLRIHLGPSEMFRFNDPNRTFAGVPEEIGQYTYVEGSQYALPSWRDFLQYRVVVTSCIDARHLVTAQFTNTALMKLKEDTFKILNPRSEVKVKPHWTHLIIDEAAQGSEPVLLIPVSIVIPHPRQLRFRSVEDSEVVIPQLVLCGDPNQLGPLICSDDARENGLDISLLERLFKRAVYQPKRKPTISSIITGYASSPLSPSNGSESGPISSKRFTNLVKNYRSHPVILMPPSAMFYGDTLQPCASNGMVAWSGLTAPHLPVKFIGHVHTEKTKDERATWYNPGEVRQVVTVIKSLLANTTPSSPPLRPGEIGVMAPWREQVWKIREALRKQGLYAVDVGTIEDFQGREIRVVIISCVRSNPRFIEEDVRKGLGLVRHRKRMNVAITRARELLVVIGNGSILQTDKHWNKFLHFCIRHKLYDGPPLELEQDDRHISKLESQLLGSNLDPEELNVLAASPTRSRALSKN